VTPVAAKLASCVYHPHCSVEKEKGERGERREGKGQGREGKENRREGGVQNPSPTKRGMVI